MPGIVREHGAEPLGGLRGAVGDGRRAGRLRLAAEAVDGHEVGVRGGVEQRVQDRPVGDAVGAVEHALGLAHGRGDRARVEVVARERDRARDAAARDRVVDEQAELAAVAVAEPADARRAGP